MTDMPPLASSEIAPVAADSTVILARAGRYYRNMRFLVVLGLLIFAGFFAYDGFKRYPQTNEKIIEVNRAYDAATTDEARASLGQMQHQLGAPHTETDIQLQKTLAFVLPVVAVVYLIFFLRRSRGEIRYENDTLYVPGYAPVPLASIIDLDDTLWKKKGIAVVNYTDGDKRKSITLDDFVYQQTPIDAIHDRIAAKFTPPSV